MPSLPLSRRHLLRSLAALALLSPGMPAAAVTRYRLDPDASRVGFIYALNGRPQTGEMPVRTADIRLDPQNLAAASVTVTLDVNGARAALPLAAAALKSAAVLDAARFPDIRFISRSVRLAADGRLSGGATVTGDVTIRGVTRPLTLQADVFRARGSAPNDLSALTVRLRGTVSRSAFGATGYADLVDDDVTLDITAALRAL